MSFETNISYRAGRSIIRPAFLLSVLWWLTVSMALGQGKAQKFNPILPDNIADPSVAYFDGVFYLYGTTDIDQGLAQMGPPVVWRSEDFVNWSFEGTILKEIDWNKPYEYIDKEGKQKTGYFRYWAPGRPMEKDGKYYLFPTIVKPDGHMGIYVVTADHSEGPFEFATGDGFYFNEPEKKSREAKPLIEDIDGEVFVDHDGQAYVYWRRRKAAKLSEDWLSLDGEVVDISTSHGGYSEGPTLFEREGIYYYLYTLSGHANYVNAYMISKEGPLGPFVQPEGPDIFIHSDVEAGIWGPGHGNIFQVPGKDEYMFLYLEYGEGSTTRQVFANWMKFNPDGTIQPMKLDFKGVGYLGKKNNRRNRALSAHATASSHQPEKETHASIEMNPNQLEEVGFEFEGGTVKEVHRTFTYQPENAIDGSNWTRWVAGEGDASPWLQLDLGKAQKVKEVSLAFVHPAFGHAFVLEKSLDGENWETVMRQEEKAVRTPHIIPEIGKTRYLKVTVIEGYPGLWEMKVY